MKDRVVDFGTKLVAAFAVEQIAEKLIEFGKASFEAAAALGNAAERTGVAVDSLSRLKYVAEQNDVSFEALTQSIKHYQVIVSQAASGSKDSADALALLSLKAEQLKGLSLEDQLKLIADQFARIRDPADQTRVAVELFTRSGEQMVPVLKKGGTAIGELISKADELGITLNENTVGAVDRADKALKSLLATISGAGQRAAGNIALAIMGPKDEVDAASATIDKLLEQRKMLEESAKSAGPDAPAWFQKINADSMAKVNAQLDAARKNLTALKKAATDNAAPALEIPKQQGPITDVIITQRKAELTGLAKLLDDFEVSTRTSEEKIYQDYKDTVAKIQEISAKIGADETAKRLKDARIKYEEAVTIDPVKISQSKVVVTQTLSEQQRAVNKFVDTLDTGLENLAQSGKITGNAILKYLLSAFGAQVLKDAIDGLGSYLKKTLGGAGGSGSTGSLIGSVISGLFGSGGGSGEISPVVITQKHAAGGGSMSGPRIVGEDGPELDLGGGNIMNRRQLQFAMAGAGGITVQQGDVNVSTNATDPAAVAQYVSAVVQQNNKQLLDQLNRRLKDNYGRGLR